MRKILTLFLSVCFFSVPAFAEPFTYAPAGCDMQITFPEKPFIETKCLNSGDKQDCTDVVTFKKVVPPAASTDFRVTCVPYSKEELATYTTPVVEKTLEKLLSDQGLEAYDIASREVDGVRRSTTMSVGSKDDVPYIYTAQIWIGKGSMFTLEGSMKGEKNDKVEATFADILKKTHPVGQGTKGVKEKK